MCCSLSLCIGRMKVAGLLLLSAALCTAQTSGSDRKKQAESVNTRGCADLTLVLDNWKYAITSQVKDLLLHNHNTVLPDYGRIQPLSNALEDLYQEFNQLKQRLSHLGGRFLKVEAIVGNMTTPHQKRTKVTKRLVLKRVAKPSIRARNVKMTRLAQKLNDPLQHKVMNG